uniref:Uncharacterized protein n=1 Tax=Arundo donax TaxID=35708 RepID=A0A0A9BNA9_ARUDO
MKPTPAVFSARFASDWIHVSPAPKWLEVIKMYGRFWIFVSAIIWKIASRCLILFLW